MRLSRAELLAKAVAEVEAHDGWALGYKHAGDSFAVAVFHEDGAVEWSLWASDHLPAVSDPADPDLRRRVEEALKDPRHPPPPW